MYFRYFSIISPWKKGWALIEQIRIPFTQGCIVSGLIEVFFNCVIVISLFRNYLPLKKSGALHLNNLNPLHPTVLCVKFVKNWSGGSGEEDEKVKS